MLCAQAAVRSRHLQHSC